MTPRRKTRTGGRKGFNNYQIALMIEHYVMGGHSFKAIANCFSVTENTVAYYVNRYYYGTTTGKTMVLTIQSKINEDADIPYEELID